MTATPGSSLDSGEDKMEVDKAGDNDHDTEAGGGGHNGKQHVVDVQVKTLLKFCHNQKLPYSENAKLKPLKI